MLREKGMKGLVNISFFNFIMRNFIFLIILLYFYIVWFYIFLIFWLFLNKWCFMFFLKYNILNRVI